jgi:hypothetical protein
MDKAGQNSLSGTDATALAQMQGGKLRTTFHPCRSPAVAVVAVCRVEALLNLYRSAPERMAAHEKESLH